ncbi:MAG: arginine--tRNA ligase [Solirubrobacterales bacterium]
MSGARLNNVLDEIDAVLEGNVLSAEVGLAIPHHPGRKEFGLRGSADTWAPAGAGPAALRELRELDALAAAGVAKGGRVDLSLADSWVLERGELLESGSALPLETADLARGRSFVIDFCDPNATKALHVGHLRNIAIANALAALGRACGAEVVTQSQVGDVGRSMGEAMAGFTLFGEGTPAELGRKGDHLVGDCYSRFVAAMAAAGKVPQGLASDPVLRREEMGRDDLASELIAKWRDGDPEATALWSRLREWAMEGQAQTLARLGVPLDRLLFESDYLAEIEAAGERLLSAGLAERTDSDALLHVTGDEGYPYLVLRRPDGQSTQHLRYFAQWGATRALLRGATSIQVMGDEWWPLTEYGAEIAAGLTPGEEIHPSTCVLHGMVTVGDRVVKSSGAKPWLIDDLLDELRADPRLADLCRGDEAGAERLAAAAALGAGLSKPASQRISISRKSLLDPRENLGWALSTAAAAAWDPAHDGEPDPCAEDREYRFLIAQSQVHRRLAKRALDELDTLPLAQFHTHLSRWFLEAEQTPRLARAMRTVLAAGISSLGLGAPVAAARPVSEASARRGSNPYPAA